MRHGRLPDERARDPLREAPLVWITKYRYKVLRDRVAERARDLLRQTCGARGITIIRGAVSPDHVHMLVSAPPSLVPAKIVQYIKGRSAGSGFSIEVHPGNQLVVVAVFVRNG